RTVVLLVVLVACSDSHLLQRMQTPPTAEPRPRDQIRVMSYNVNFGVAGDESNIEAIKGAAPDIVFLQETNDRWEATLVGALGTRYPHRRFDPPTDWVAG